MINKSSIRSFIERQISTFRHENVEQIVWQPRFSDWYRVNNIYQLRKGMNSKAILELASKCPDIMDFPEIFGMEHEEIYDYLNASPRYPGECWPSMGFFSTRNNPDAEIVHKTWQDEKGNRFHKIITPFGELQESWRAGSTYPFERILKNKEDFKPVLYYLENSTYEYEFNDIMYNIFLEEREGRCVSTGSPWRSPYNKCIVELAGTLRTMVLMGRYKKEFDKFCEELARINFEVIMPTLMKSPVNFISFGDNIDCRNDPPPVYEKYILPYFERAAKECKKHGKFTYAHFDGNLEDLLPYLGEDIYPFDGIEAPTFQPQGDVTLKEFKKSLGDNIIVLDGIPSTIFLKQFSESYFIKYVENVLKTFSPNLILGVSDEYSPNGLFKRMKMVSSIVERFNP